MNKKQYRRRRDIKSKLMAAICMLLVSSIMMVSTTYAWFTLSTAPEVTGITTAVGANGNLEMALLPYTGRTEDIKSEAGDSIKVPLLKNVTWGNLVDVSDTTTYGLNSITLFPSKLNAADGVLGDRPLATPVYGADGRVSSVNANTILGAYDSINGQFTENIQYNGATINNAKGVRAVGVSSSLTARALAYRTAKADASSADSRAKRAATTSLNNRGAGLADIAIKHALNASATFTVAEIAPLKNAVADLQGVMAEIEGALKNYLIANSIANAADDAYLDIVNNITKAATLADAKAVTGAVVPNGMDTVITNMNTIVTKVNTAASELNALTTDGITWDALSKPLNRLLDTNAMTVNGFTMEQIQAPADAEGKTGKDKLVNKIIADKFQAKLVMASGAGAYADIADFCGDYSAAITMNVSYGSLNDVPVDATMSTKTTVNPVYLTQVGNAVAAYQDASGNTSSNPISEFYGYVIDLAFRTNAADSWLQLQVEGIDRIYNEEGNKGTNPETMGHGASMTFTSGSETFSQTAVRSLMSHVRIVFFDPATKQIINYAKLNAEAVTTAENGAVTMPIMLTNANGEALTDSDTTTNVDESVAIMELSQNQAHTLSVLVYLDGETMTNADVAADTAKSMTGSMNLQFSSTATLKPMEYSALKSESDSGSSTVTYTALTGMTAADGYTVGRAYYDNAGKIGFELTAPADGTLDGKTVTVTIGDQTKTATKQEFGGYAGYVIDVTGIEIAADTAMTIAVA